MIPTILDAIIRFAVFLLVSIQSLVPSNAYIPLDRRLSSLLGAVICILCKLLLHSHSNAFLMAENSVDMTVLVILASTMVINFVIIRQPIVAKVLRLMNKSIRKTPRLGFWIVSGISFVLSPLLMNDGVCLLMVTPVLESFDESDASDEIRTNQEAFYAVENPISY